jgi:hypothetical protein
MGGERTLMGFPIIEVDTMPHDAIGAVEFGPKREALHIHFTHSEKVFFYARCLRCGFNASNRAAYDAHDCDEKETR